MNHRNLIENTKSFKELPAFKKNIYKSGKNIQHLSEQYVLAKNTSYESWKASHKPSDVEDKIIKELLNPKP